MLRQQVLVLSLETTGLWRNLLAKHQQPFYGPLIQDNQGEPVPEPIGHINPAIITILLSTSNQSSPSLQSLHIPINYFFPFQDKWHYCGQ